MTSGASAMAAPPSESPKRVPFRGKPRKSPIGADNSSSNNNNNGMNDSKSPTTSSSVLLHPQVTLTCYIPSHCVGAVIGRRGSTIVQIQKYAQQFASSGSNSSVRLSIVVANNNNTNGNPEDDVPYTHSSLDWDSPHWTPVVIRADPSAALKAAERLEELVEEIDEVILDLPLSRTKHAALVGKKGLVLAHLSAETGVRIMVPRRDLRQDVVQLEGTLENVSKCLEQVLVLASKKSPSPVTSAATTTATTSVGGSATSAAATTEVGVVIVPLLPSQTKLRNVGRKTDTVIKKKKAEEGDWQLTVTGGAAQVAAAVAILEKWKDEQGSSSSANGEPRPSPITTPATTTSNKPRPRLPGRKGKKPKSANETTTTTSIPVSNT